jgi:hypothetical protein
MKKFEDLKSQWENQPEIETPNDGAKLIVKKVNFIKKEQRITNIILGMTSIILISFFFYISAYNNVLVAAALLLMVGSLLVRMIIEYISMRKLKQINRTVGVVDFKKNLVDYYKKRIKTHYVFTPIIMILYIVGFVILLPFFKESLSSGFYTYIQVSSIVVLLVLVFFIRKQILKEMLILKELSS